MLNRAAMHGRRDKKPVDNKLDLFSAASGVTSVELAALDTYYGKVGDASEYMKALDIESRTRKLVEDITARGVQYGEPYFAALRGNTV